MKRSIIKKGLAILSAATLILAAGCGNTKAADSTKEDVTIENEQTPANDAVVSEDDKKVTVGVCAGPYGDMFEDCIQPSLEKLGYEVEIIEISDTHKKTARAAAGVKLSRREREELILRLTKEMRAAARILSDEKTVQLDYGFEKVTQNGWRNYQYLYFGEPEEEAPAPVQNRYARPQPKPVEPEILSGTLKMPMTDTTSFRQTLFLEVGKPVLAARISNPAYQPDTLTLLFVTATVEEAEPPLR